MWPLVGTIASVLGLAAGVAFGAYQYRVAVRAEKKADEERSRRASLEEHLERQRWQQLKSLGEQIDALDSDGRKESEPRLARLHASLREQYSSLLGVIATSADKLDATVVRSWVNSGRLRRPWQIAEAISHLNQENLTSGDPKDKSWLDNLISDGSVVPKPRPITKPKEPTPYVAAYILMANAAWDELRPFVREGGYNHYPLTVLLDHLAEDCVALCNIGEGSDPTLIAWGHENRKPFSERFEHYRQHDFWVLVNAADAVAEKLKEFDRYFNHKGDIAHRIVPKQTAVQELRKRYPEIAEQCRAVLNGG